MPLFGDRLIKAVRKAEHPLCVGIDPHLDMIPSIFRVGDMSPNSPQTVAAVRTFIAALMDRITPKVPVIKPQSAFFEQMGWRGVEVLDSLMKRARANGVLVILDVKRGDVGSTAEAYARAYLSRSAPLRADAITINPYLGMDSLEPFIEEADASKGGLFVLVKTSNAGAKDFQDLEVGERTVYEAVADSLAPIAERHEGPETGWSSIGAVVGATKPKEAAALRRRLPKSPFLVPGFGAQGASAKDAFAGFVKGPSGLEGGVINTSRAVLFPKLPIGATSKDWERAVDGAIDTAIDALKTAAQSAKKK